MLIRFSGQSLDIVSGVLDQLCASCKLGLPGRKRVLKPGASTVQFANPFVQAG
jgi:hypothetical protein